MLEFWLGKNVGQIRDVVHIHLISTSNHNVEKDENKRSNNISDKSMYLKCSLEIRYLH